MKTSELTGAALDWAVAQAAGYTTSTLDLLYDIKSYDRFHPSTDWVFGGPILEREDIMIQPEPRVEGWWAHKMWGTSSDCTGPTPLVAAMRCFVASKFGDDIDIPEELCH